MKTLRKGFLMVSLGLVLGLFLTACTTVPTDASTDSGRRRSPADVTNRARF